MPVGDIAEVLAFGRDVVRRIDSIRCCPADRAGERAHLLKDSLAFVARADEAREWTGAGLILQEGRTSSGQYQELLALVCRIGREINSGLFYR